MPKKVYVVSIGYNSKNVFDKYADALDFYKMSDKVIHEETNIQLTSNVACYLCRWCFEEEPWVCPKSNIVDKVIKSRF